MRFETEATVARGAFAWGLVALGFLVLAAADFGYMAPYGLYPSAVSVCVALIPWILIVGPRLARWSWIRRRVVADATGLFVDGKSILARAVILRGVSIARGMDRHSIHIQARAAWRNVTITVDSGDENRSLLAALDLQSDRVVARFRGELPGRLKYAPLLPAFALIAASIGLLGRQAFSGWSAAAMFGFLAIAPLLLSRLQRAEVGHDGILLRWLGRQRFVPFSEVARVRKTSTGALQTWTGVEVWFPDGTTHDIGFSGRVGGEVEAAALSAAIEAGVAKHAHSNADAPALLMRGGREVEIWRREMLALGSSQGRYRTMPLTRDRLWNIVEDASADPSAREGAAIALSAALDDDERARLVALTLRTVSPGLRAALEAAAHTPTRPLVQGANEDEIDGNDAEESREVAAGR